MDGGAAVLATGSAFAASLGINSLLAKVARRRGWCDRPDSRLKNHRRPVPFVGGIGVLAGLALSATLFGRASASPGPAWIAAGALGLAAGLWDDFRWKTAAVPLPKLAVQTTVALAAGLLVALTGLGPVKQPLLNFALGAGFVLGSMNALNLEDGMDGLAAGEAVVSGLGLAVLLAAGRFGAIPALGLAGALAGFLVLNWHPARMFLGDGGSHLVGATLAVLALAACRGSGPAALPGAVLIIGLPVFGTAWVIVRRLFCGQRVMGGGRDHLYDLLHATGLSVRKTVVVCWLGHAVLVAAGVLWVLKVRQ